MPTDTKFGEAFWSERYQKQETGWNIGYPSTPITAYIDQLEETDLRILIPGAGNSYEAEYLHKNGFGHVHVLDISNWPLANLARRIPDFPVDHLIHSDFFEYRPEKDLHYDLILEQTFFCALDPHLRQAYADQMFSLLRPGGKLAGLWFSFALEDEQENPPFGGSLEEYLRYFGRFDILTFDTCYNSIESRNGKELFAILQKPAA
jgi:thiopurine S-methyltransferase